MMNTLRLFSIIALACLSISVPGEEWLKSFSDVETYLESRETASMEEVISKLAPDFRQNYALVYSSRSTMEGSLRKPRVLLFSRDSKTAIAFSGDPESKNGMKMEILEADPKTEQISARLIEFTSEGRAHVDRAPKNCIECHGKSGGRFGLKMIWDTYPDWAGIYGSAHVINEGRGTSLLAIPEFEEVGFQDFLKHSASQGRYKHLLSPFNVDLHKLAFQNSIITTDVANINWGRIVEAAKTSTNLKFTEALITSLDRGKSTRPRSTRQELEKEIRAGNLSYLKDKYHRIQAIISRLGTDSDRKLFSDEVDVLASYPKSKPRLYMMNHEEDTLSNLATMIQVMRDDLKLDTSELSFTLEANSFAFTGGRAAPSIGITGALEEKIFRPQFLSALNQAASPEEFAEVLDIGSLQNKIGLYRETSQGLEALYRLSGGSTRDINALIEKNKFSFSIREALLRRSLALTHYSPAQINFLIGSPAVSKAEKRVLLADYFHNKKGDPYKGLRVTKDIPFLDRMDCFVGMIKSRLGLGAKE